MEQKTLTKRNQRFMCSEGALSGWGVRFFVLSSQGGDGNSLGCNFWTFLNFISEIV